MNELNETLVDMIQNRVQHQLDGIYESVNDLRYPNGFKVEGSHKEVEELIDQCIKNWLLTGDVYD